MHGGLSTGPRTDKGKNSIRQAHWITGFYSKAAIDERRSIRQEISEARSSVTRILNAT